MWSLKIACEQVSASLHIPGSNKLQPLQVCFRVMELEEVALTELELTKPH